MRLDRDATMEIYARALWRCEVCGKSVRHYGTPQLAHRIARTKANIKRYGREVICHPSNLAPVCSLRCNDACNVGNNPRKAREIVDLIHLTDGK